MNSKLKDILAYAKLRGLPIMLYSCRGLPFIVEPKRYRQALTQERYDWKITHDRIKLYEDGYEGNGSPAARRKRKALKDALAQTQSAG